MKMKKNVNLIIDESLWTMMKLIADSKETGISELLEDLIRTYVIMNKVSLNEYMENYWNNSIK